MAKIKSALELALESTADIKFDKEASEKKDAYKSGQVIASRLLNDPTSNLDPIKELSKYKGDIQKEAMRGASEVLLSRLVMPRENNDLAKLTPLESAFNKLSSNHPAIKDIFSQLKGFFQQYIDQAEQLLTNLMTQLEPQIRQKEQMLKEQHGPDYQFNPHDDPQFMKILEDQSTHLKQQYEDMLKNIKAELKTLF